MIPDYIRDEINNRLSVESLHRSKAKAICRMLGIELEAALESYTAMELAVADLGELAPAAEHEGAVFFQFGTQAKSDKRRVHGRVVFVTTPYGIDGTLGHMVSTCEALIWDGGEPAPIWQAIPEGMLPPDLLAAAYEEIDALATAKSRADVR